MESGTTTLRRTIFVVCNLFPATVQAAEVATAKETKGGITKKRSQKKLQDR
jgi:hypothetical protein